MPSGMMLAYVRSSREPIPSLSSHLPLGFTPDFTDTYEKADEGR